MASKFTELAIDCADPNALARFRCSVLDYEVQEEGDDGLSQLAPQWCLRASTAMAESHRL
jgi:hypothetical protein